MPHEMIGFDKKSRSFKLKKSLAHLKEIIPCGNGWKCVSIIAYLFIPIVPTIIGIRSFIARLVREYYHLITLSLHPLTYPAARQISAGRQWSRRIQ